MNKTSQDQIDRNSKWAGQNLDKVRGYKRKYKYEQKRLCREYIKTLKEKTMCQICGNKNIHCLDFHHRPNTNKKDTISNLIRHGYALSIVKEEIEKCDIICSNCHRTQHYTGKYMRNKKAILVHKIKLINRCSLCNFNKVECLDFHHTNDNKENGIGFMIRDKNVSMIQLETEIKKCIILCSNCHRTLHTNDKETEH